MKTKTPPEIELEGIIGSGNNGNGHKVIDSNRFKLGGLIGRGTWGAVYAAHDNLLGEDVAIKVLDPTELAKELMKQRNINPQEAVKKEAAKPAACSNVVPRHLEEDKNGRLFIVMPKYDRFLSQELHRRN